MLKTTPIAGVNAALGELVEGGVWVFARAACESVFDRVEVDVIGVAFKLEIVFDLMFPESALPDAAFSAFLFGFAYFLLESACFQVRLCEAAFNETPAPRVIGVRVG